MIRFLFLVAKEILISGTQCNPTFIGRILRQILCRSAPNRGAGTKILEPLRDRHHMHIKHSLNTLPGAPGFRMNALRGRVAASLITLFSVLAAVTAFAQTNEPPQITGQVSLSTAQDTPIDILFEHLTVFD